MGSSVIKPHRYSPGATNSKATLILKG
jgi:hypothetical protein